MRVGVPTCNSARGLHGGAEILQMSPALFPPHNWGVIWCSYPPMRCAALGHDPRARFPSHGPVALALALGSSPRAAQWGWKRCRGTLPIPSRSGGGAHLAPSKHSASFPLPREHRENRPVAFAGAKRAARLEHFERPPHPPATPSTSPPRERCRSDIHALPPLPLGERSARRAGSGGLDLAFSIPAPRLLLIT